eukprot:6185154-Pleurochrysis_carterae.AAC.1
MKGPAPDTLLAAARALLADGISPVNSSATLLRLGSEYSRIAVKLNVTPHPKLVKACLSCIDEINVRDTVLDIGSVCALLHLLPKFPRLRALRTWRCELSKAAVELLADFLPKIEHIARNAAPYTSSKVKHVHSTAHDSKLVALLDLDMCPAVSSSMEKFLNFPHLTILSLRACELDEVAASSLATALGELLHGGIPLCTLSGSCYRYHLCVASTTLSDQLSRVNPIERSVKSCESNATCRVGFPLLAETNNALRALDLWGNRLRTEGISLELGGMNLQLQVRQSGRIELFQTIRRYLPQGVESCCRRSKAAKAWRFDYAN